MKVPKKHHFVYRQYLAPWTNTERSDGKIWAYPSEKGEIFNSSLMGVAQQRYFNEYQKLTEIEKFVTYFIIKATNDPDAKLSKPFLESLNALRIFATLETVNVPVDSSQDVQIETINRNMRIKLGEDSHSFYEIKGLPYLQHLLNGDVAILDDDEELFSFLFFLLIQCARTKRSRDSFSREYRYTSEFLLKSINVHGGEMEVLGIPFDKVTAISELKELESNYNPEKVHQYVTDSLSFFAAYQLMSKKRPKVHLINVQDGLELLTSDHPVISLGGLDRDPAFYLPISPTKAIILSFDNRSDTDSFDESDVLKYNKLVIDSYSLHVFSASKELLIKMMKS